MSSNKQILPVQTLFTGEEMTGTDTITSPAVEISRLDNVGIQVQWTGDPTGTFAVLASVDGESFYSLTFDPALGAPSGSDGGFLIDLEMCPFNSVKLEYTNASGTGALTAFLCAKGLN